MKTQLYIAILLLSLFSFTCGDKVDDGHKYICFINRSDSTIYVGERWQIIIQKTDTIFGCGGWISTFEKGKTRLFEPLNNYWETDFKAIPFVQFFVFSQRPPYLSERCEDVISEFSHTYQLKRYQLTKEDLDRMNWTITYP
jgi:hypothetical protein